MRKCYTCKTPSFDGVQNVSFIILFYFCFQLWLMLLPLLWADVFTHFLLWHLLCHYFVLCGRCKTTSECLTLTLWQMLLSVWQMETHMLNARCILPIVADGVATVADGIATFVGMFHCGRCYYHCGR